LQPNLENISPFSGAARRITRDPADPTTTICAIIPGEQSGQVFGDRDHPLALVHNKGENMHFSREKQQLLIKSRRSGWPSRERFKCTEIKC
jgi:hypothetical protein